MDVIAGVAVIGALALVLRWIVVALVRRIREGRNSGNSASQPGVPAVPAGENPGEQRREAAAARALAGLYVREERQIAGLGLLDDPRVAAVVQGLAQPAVPVAECWDVARSRENLFEVIFGLAALRDRTDTPQEVVDWAVGTALRDVHTLVEPFVYALLLERAERPVIGRALAALPAGLDQDALVTFIVARRAKEEISQATFSEHVPLEVAESVSDFVRAYESRLGTDFRELFETWHGSAVDTSFLREVGAIWQAPYDRPETLVVGDDEIIGMMCEALEHEPPRSLLLVGEHGVGKSALLRAALDRSRRQVIVFEATASQINAGAMYVGQSRGGRRTWSSGCVTGTSSGSCRRCRRRSTQASTTRAHRVCLTRSSRTSRVARSASSGRSARRNSSACSRRARVLRARSTWYAFARWARRNRWRWRVTPWPAATAAHMRRTTRCSRRTSWPSSSCRGSPLPGTRSGS